MRALIRNTIASVTMFIAECVPVYVIRITWPEAHGKVYTMKGWHWFPVSAFERLADRNRCPPSGCWVEAASLREAVDMGKRT